MLKYKTQAKDTIASYYLGYRIVQKASTSARYQVIARHPAQSYE